MKNVVEDKEKGCLIRSDGFQVEIQPDEKGGVFVLFFGKVPRRLKYVVDKHKDLFVNVGMARALVCNEISGM